MFKTSWVIRNVILYTPSMLPNKKSFIQKGRRTAHTNANQFSDLNSQRPTALYTSIKCQPILTEWMTL